ncbi:multisubunit potassium/proton antiporter, PhaE subunit [Methylobacillus rhizosphaerae]|uniref:Multisubunit potassium/proton antiporter, PhaE subunit n=1 Tax=Methylobacillus rhizosphaerae TaxID=551994 RepID=A0A239B4A5_9PROT|nr:Na+/H+ antiporter subunit E [Methylobacillus rhizosphaerae]SNS02362.1 multisubunit potassium/proton antiporter, PhaE subunit [Methylobacillus rhizosphaerae]
MQRLLPHPLLTIILAIIWLLLNNSIAPGQITLGLLLGWAIPFFALQFWPTKLKVHKPLTLLKFSYILLYDIIEANFIVALRILGKPEKLRPAFIVVPIDLNSDFAMSILANTSCLTPGSLSALLAPDRKSILMHAMDVEDVDVFIHTIKTRYEQPLKEIFEE